MGQWFARFLKGDGWDVVISGRDEAKLRGVAEGLGVEAASGVAAVKGADVIMVSVSIESFEDVVREIGQHITETQTVIDVTSIKVAPVAAFAGDLRGFVERFARFVRPTSQGVQLAQSSVLVRGPVQRMTGFALFQASVKQFFGFVQSPGGQFHHAQVVEGRQGKRRREHDGRPIGAPPHVRDEREVGADPTCERLAEVRSRDEKWGEDATDEQPPQGDPEPDETVLPSLAKARAVGRVPGHVPRLRGRLRHPPPRGVPADARGV